MVELNEIRIKLMALFSRENEPGHVTLAYVVSGRLMWLVVDVGEERTILNRSKGCPGTCCTCRVLRQRKQCNEKHDVSKTLLNSVLVMFTQPCSLLVVSISSSLMLGVDFASPTQALSKLSFFIRSCIIIIVSSSRMP